MRSIIILLSVLFIGALTIELSEKELQKSFIQFMRDHKKSYKQDELVHRFTIFKQNVEYIERWNNDPSSSFRLKINKFGDLTVKEYRDIYLRFKSSKRERHVDPDLANIGSIPASWDWRMKGAVTPVGNQDQCGSCWAFSVTGSVEGCHKITTGTLVALSQQQLLDCDTQDEGCNGGFMDTGFQYIIQNGGIDSLKCYPYEGIDQTCNYRNSCCASTVTSFKDVVAGDENSLLAATSLVPVAFGMDASQQSFQFYSEGVYYDPNCSSTNLDHSALTVGWGTTSNGTDYWIVKNSWGTSWGNNGYILMSRNRQNNCGIASEASYVQGCNNCAS